MSFPIRQTELNLQYNQMDAPSFALSASHIAIAVKAPRLNNAMHTREDVYILDLSHIHAAKPSHLTPHDHGAISGLTFSPDGSKLAWLEMAEDGYESDRRVVIVHDTKKAVRWTDTWDRSPSSITVRLDSIFVHAVSRSALIEISGREILTRYTCWPSIMAESSLTISRNLVTSLLP